MVINVCLTWYCNHKGQLCLSPSNFLWQDVMSLLVYCGNHLFLPPYKPKKMFLSLLIGMRLRKHSDKAINLQVSGLFFESDRLAVSLAQFLNEEVVAQLILIFEAMSHLIFSCNPRLQIRGIKFSIHNFAKRFLGL